MTTKKTSNIIRTSVTDGVNDAVKLSLGPEATAADALALLKTVSLPRETLTQELERRAAVIQNKITGEPWASQIGNHIAEARYLLSQRAMPAAVRVPLERAEFAAFQSQAAPLAAKGRKFVPNGRGPGPIRKAIERLLKKQPAMKNAALWEALQTKPPKGYTLRDNRLGRYIEGPEGENMNEARFRNVCAEVRKVIKAQK